MADVGTGTTIVFGTSGFSAQVLSINGNDISREPIDTSHLGTVDYRTFMPGDLVDPGNLEIEFAIDPNEQPPIDQPAETITVTFPIPSGSASGATCAGEGFLTTWSWGTPLEERMTGSGTIKCSGEWTWTPGA